jgi:hypothetical protein
MIGSSTHYTDAYPIALVPSSEAINHIDAVPGVEIINGTLTVDTPNLEMLLAQEACHM